MENMFAGLFGYAPSPINPSVMMNQFEVMALRDQMARGHKAQMAAEAQRPLTEAQAAILAKGSATLSPYCNVAAGYGFDVYALERKGMFRSTTNALYSYEITPQGVEALEAARIARLASIGVYEC